MLSVTMPVLAVPLPAAAAVAILALLLLLALLTPRHHPQEPPLVRPKIPYFGHAIGIFRHGARYYSDVARQNPHHPILTLPLPLNRKLYLATSPALISACDRRPKTVSFAPYVVQFARRILACSAPSIRLLSADLSSPGGAPSHKGLRAETMAVMRRALMPGEEGMERVVRETVAGFGRGAVDGVVGRGEGVGLFGWVRGGMTVAATDAVYGEGGNPLREGGVLEGFWDVEQDFARLGLPTALSAVVAPAGSRGRTRFFQAFRKYYASGGLDAASHLIKARHAVHQKHGVAAHDLERFDLGVCTALLGSMVPALGWSLFMLFSDGPLLERMRAGIDAFVAGLPREDHLPNGDNEKTVPVVTVNVRELVDAVPLLESFVREVLRTQTNGTSARFLLKDTVVDDGGSTYLLKKGCFLMIPAAPVHRDEALWGPTAEAFDPDRFVPEKQQQQGSRKVPASGWRAFGGGHNLCPGRHLAMREMLSIIAMMVARCEIEPCEGSWRTPEKVSHVSAGVVMPVEDVRVRIRSREGAERFSWRFVWEAGVGGEAE